MPASEGPVSVVYFLFNAVTQEIDVLIARHSDAINFVKILVSNSDVGILKHTMALKINGKDFLHDPEKPILMLHKTLYFGV